MAVSQYTSRILPLLEDVHASIQFLTRVPVPRWNRREGRSLAAAMWAFPLVGVLAATAAALVFAVGDWLELPGTVSALATVAALFLITGGLHEDGLADFADGVFGGYTPEERLAIMADSRIGTFGALALVVSVTGRTASVAAIEEPVQVLGALVAAAAMSRAGMPILMAALKPVRADGLGAAAGQPGIRVWGSGLVIAIAIVLLAAPGGWFACLAAAAAGVTLVGWVAHRCLGGYTGDAIGAAQQLAELLALALIAAAVQSAD